MLALREAGRDHKRKKLVALRSLRWEPWVLPTACWPKGAWQERGKLLHQMNKLPYVLSKQVPLLHSWLFQCPPSSPSPKTAGPAGEDILGQTLFSAPFSPPGFFCLSPPPPPVVSEIIHHHERSYLWCDRCILCCLAEMNAYTLCDAGLPNATGSFTACVSSSDLHWGNREPGLGFRLRLMPWHFHCEVKWNCLNPTLS